MLMQIVLFMLQTIGHYQELLTLLISVNISIFIHCTKHNLYGYKYVRDYLCSSCFDPSDSTVIGECSVR